MQCTLKKCFSSDNQPRPSRLSDLLDHCKTGCTSTPTPSTTRSRPHGPPQAFSASTRTFLPIDSFSHSIALLVRLSLASIIELSVNQCHLIALHANLLTDLRPSHFSHLELSVSHAQALLRHGNSLKEGFPSCLQERI